MKKLFVGLLIIFMIVFSISLFAQDNQGMTQQKQDQAQTDNNSTPVQPTTVEENTNAEVAKPGVYQNKQTYFIPLKAEFDIKADDEISGVAYIEYSIDDKGFVQYTKPITFKKEGYHTVAYRVFDNVGNVNFEKTISICVDSSAPILQLIPTSSVYQFRGLNYVPAGYNFYLRAFDTYSGVKQIYYAINDGEFQEYSEPLLFDKGGNYTIKYYAVDNVGNVSNVFVYQFIVDDEKPLAEIIPAEEPYMIGDKFYAKSGFQIEIKGHDSLSGVKLILVSVDGGDFLPYAGPITFTEEGEHTVSVSIIDNVGNTSDTWTLSGVIDNTPPKSQFEIMMPGTEDQVKQENNTEEQNATNEENNNTDNNG